MKYRLIALCILTTAGVASLSGQSSGAAAPKPIAASSPSGWHASPDYVLGPGDQITLAVPGLDDDYNESKIFRVDGTGDMSLPWAGRIHAAGFTAGGLERLIETKLEPILKHPQVVVTVSSFGSQPVSVLGSVKNPGILQLQGRKTLFDVLSMAGGTSDDAGYVVRITRPLESGPIPLPNAQVDQATGTSVASVRLKDLVGVPRSSENIQVLPGDTISVPKAGVVYAVGSVVKPGGFSLDENESLSALQVVSLAEGLQPASASSKAKILRVVPNSPNRAEIPVDLNRLMAGKTQDVQLQPQDILFVPSSNAKKAGLRLVDVISQAAALSVVYAH